ncbi:MAG: hypothetical protein DI622_01580 [Chryseobacterium sp.]|uniref:hypothetical protein n=1 Tax=Chryseobacterium sp. TaxID=1871047 RepID=UPI000DB61D2A|nr:hypothetical protein [Chryseobacterium sp.]MPS65256.1 hypothetical protein [Chryseobacterium sp.]PZU26114.1 MAG: hypothetical protein DI622_01580 [Chryseobacterium sp.]
MKKLTLFIFLFLGIFAFSQSHTLVIVNNTGLDAVGRLITASRTTPGGPFMFAFPNPPYTSFTIPSGQMVDYGHFDTAGASSVSYPIPGWNVVNNPNPAFNGPQPYNSPAVSSMVTLNEWAGFLFSLVDPITGDPVDDFAIGNPAIAANASFVVYTNQLGANTGIPVEWVYVGSIVYLFIG